MKSLANSSNRRYKLLKTVAFFKLIASSVFIGKEIYGGIGVGGGFGYKTTPNPPKRPKIERTFIDQNNFANGNDNIIGNDIDSLVVGNSFYVMNQKSFGGDFPLNVIEQSAQYGLRQPSVAQLQDKWISSNSYKPIILENDLNFLDLQVEHQKLVREDVNKEEIKRKSNLYIGTSKGRAPNQGIEKSNSKSSNTKPRPNSSSNYSQVHSELTSYKNNKVTRKLTTQETVMIKQRQAFLMKKMIYRLFLRMSHSKRTALLKWYRQTMRSQIKEYLQEFENMNIVLSERAFREKLFRTKIKVLQGKIDSRIEYFGALMQEEINDEQIEQLRNNLMEESMNQLPSRGRVSITVNKTDEEKSHRSRNSKNSKNSRSVSMSKKNQSKIDKVVSSSANLNEFLL